jgi:hypothetical protein
MRGVGVEPTFTCSLLCVCVCVCVCVLSSLTEVSETEEPLRARGACACASCTRRVDKSSMLCCVSMNRRQRQQSVGFPAQVSGDVKRSDLEHELLCGSTCLLSVHLSVCLLAVALFFGRYDIDNATTSLLSGQLARDAAG